MQTIKTTILQLPLIFALRFTINKHTNKFINIIAIISILGLALGITALITVLSVMNGFQLTVSEKLFNSIPHITLMSSDKNKNWTEVNSILDSFSSIKLHYPSIQKQIFFIKNNKINPIFLNAIPNEILKSKLSKLHTSPDPFISAENPLIISNEVLNKMAMKIKDKVTIVSSEKTNIYDNNDFQYFSFNISGAFPTTDPLTSQIALMPINKAKKIFNNSSYISSTSIILNNPFQASEIINELRTKLPYDISMTTWNAFFNSYFQALSSTKQIMFLMLSLIIIIAAFNASASMIMIIKEQTPNIAILRVLGGSKFFIFRIFILQGLLICTTGIFLGVMGGYFLSKNITSLTYFLQQLLNTKFVNHNVYFIDYLPAYFEWHDVFHVSLFTFIIVIISSIIPAWQASQKLPTKILKYK